MTQLLLVAMALVFLAIAAVLTAAEAAFNFLPRHDAEEALVRSRGTAMRSILSEPVAHVRALRFWRIWFEMASAVAVAVPRYRVAWVLIAVLAFSTLLEPGRLTPRLLAVIAAVHVLHVLASWILAVPALARLQPAVLLPSLRRLIAVQVPVQAVAVVLLSIARPPLAPWLAIVSGAAIAGLVVLLAALLLTRPGD